LGGGGWVERLKESLRSLGVPFESEAEAFRISVEGASLEVAESPEGYAVVATIPLPGPGEADTARQACKALEVMARLGVELKYEVDESLPGYPMLRVTAPYRDPSELASKLVEALKALQGRP
jgi:hypothetical protein